MEPEGPLPYSQQPGIDPYPEPDESVPQPISLRPILSLSFHVISCLPSFFLHTVFHPEHVKHFFCLPHLTNNMSVQLLHSKFEHTNISLDVQITKPHIMQISPFPSYFLCLTSKHFLDSMFATPPVYFLPLM